MRYALSRVTLVYEPRITCKLCNLTPNKPNLFLKKKKETNRQRLINKDRKFRVFSCDWLCNTAGTAANPGKNWKHNLLVRAIFLWFWTGCVVFFVFSKKWQHAKSITRNNNNNHLSSLKAVHHIYLELQNNLFNRSQVNIFLTSKMYKLAKKSTDLCLYSSANHVGFPEGLNTFFLWEVKNNSNDPQRPLRSLLLFTS